LDIDGWLLRIGLPQYAELFRANDIDGELLGRLTNDDLKDIGVDRTRGHRRHRVGGARATIDKERARESAEGAEPADVVKPVAQTQVMTSQRGAGQPYCLQSNRLRHSGRG
jgi:SAM domain (Sterile alpha motif)